MTKIRANSFGPPRLNRRRAFADYRIGGLHEPQGSRAPGAIPAGAQPYLKLAPSTRFVSVELTYRDGSVSEIKSFRR
jgi:hypothetical protein